MKVGIIGSGTMGQGIALVAAGSGDSVIVTDASAAALGAGLSSIEQHLARRRERGKLSADAEGEIRSRMTTTGDLSNFAECELIIEAVVEQLDVKRDLFRELDRIVSPIAILATNTSSLSVTAIAAACERPERALGMHFFNPAPVLPLVEIVAPLQTAEENVQRAMKIAAKWGKKPIRVQDTPAFVVNRIARPFYGEALRILEEGIADVPTIDYAVKRLGEFKMGPFELMDLIGIDINHAVTESVFQAFAYDARYRPSVRQRRMVEAAYLGRKNGRGFYRYQADEVNPGPSGDDRILRAVFDRILAMLINEAVDALFWRIATADEIDQAVVLGMNYPKGLLTWGREIGWKAILERLDSLRSEYGEERYRASPLLRRAVKMGVCVTACSHAAGGAGEGRGL